MPPCATAVTEPLNKLCNFVGTDRTCLLSARCPGAAFFILVCYTTYLFFAVDETAGYLMLPYVAWVAFANFLNLGIVKKN
jgi:tryptophan-rich sensory protein